MMDMDFKLPPAKCPASPRTVIAVIAFAAGAYFANAMMQSPAAAEPPPSCGAVQAISPLPMVKDFDPVEEAFGWPVMERIERAHYDGPEPEPEVLALADETGSVRAPEKTIEKPAHRKRHQARHRAHKRHWHHWRHHRHHKRHMRRHRHSR